jgi:valyl-tRNA synthetase
MNLPLLRKVHLLRVFVSKIHEQYNHALAFKHISQFARKIHLPPNVSAGSKHLGKQHTEILNDILMKHLRHQNEKKHFMRDTSTKIRHEKP